MLFAIDFNKKINTKIASEPSGPPWLQGLGLQANYTYVDSKVKRYNAVYSAYCTPGAGQENLNLYINMIFCCH